MNERKGTIVPELEFDSVSFSYPGISVLENISFSVRKGEFLALLGHNGSGKTTLMKLALGLLKPSKGRILFRGHEIGTLSGKRNIGYVQQNVEGFDFQFPATVKEVVMLGRLNGMKTTIFDYSEHDYDVAEKAMHTVGIHSLASRRIGELSGGQLQKVFLAKTLAGEAEVLFLDEPASAMDIASQKEFYQLLRTLNSERGITVMLISHDLGQILKYASRVIAISRKVVFEGEPSKFDINSMWSLAERI